jgi:hypothetical protein
VSSSLSAAVPIPRSCRTRSTSSKKSSSSASAFLARLDPPDLELDPVPAFQMMDTAIEREEELEAMLVIAFHIIS